jgi:hypothetical protein
LPAWAFAALFAIASAIAAFFSSSVSSLAGYSCAFFASSAICFFFSFFFWFAFLFFKSISACVSTFPSLFSSLVSSGTGWDPAESYAKIFSASSRSLFFCSFLLNYFGYSTSTQLVKICKFTYSLLLLRASLIPFRFLHFPPILLLNFIQLLLDELQVL